MSDEGQEKQQRRDGYGNGNYMKSWIILMFSVYTPTRIRFGVGDSKHWLKSSTRNHILNVLFTLYIPHFHQETTTPWSMVDGEEWREVKTLSSLVDSRVIIIFFFNSTSSSSSTFSCTLCCLFEWSKSYRTSGYWLRKSSKEHIINYRITFLSSLCFSVRLRRVQREDLAVFEFQLIANCSLSFFSMCSQFSHLSSASESQSPRECVQESW